MKNGFSNSVEFRYDPSPEPGKSGFPGGLDVSSERKFSGPHGMLPVSSRPGRSGDGTTGLSQRHERFGRRFDFPFDFFLSSCYIIK